MRSGIHRVMHAEIHQRYGPEMTAAELWAPFVPEGAYVINGIIYFPEQEEEEEVFSSDLLSRHPDCLALPMHEEYVRLYDAHGEEKAKAFLHEISNQLTSKTLSLAATDEEINAFARKLADQFTRLQCLFKNPAIAARVLCHVAQTKDGITPPGMNKADRKVSPSVSVTASPALSATAPVTNPKAPLFPVTITDREESASLASSSERSL